MRLLWVLALAGCHYGAGPVIAYSDHGLRLGAEVSGGVTALRGSTGATIAPAHGLFRFYGTFEPGFAYPVDDNERIYPGVGGTFGFAANTDDVGLAAGAWVSTSFTRPCDGRDRSFVASIAIGVRGLAGVEELYVTPKAGFVECIGNIAH